MFKSLLTFGNIKFVVPVGMNTTAPMETMTHNRVYVTLDKEGNLFSISYYDKNNKRNKQIDFKKPHLGVLPHTHHGCNHCENDTKKGFSNLTPKEKQMIRRVTDKWRERKADVWSRWLRIQSKS